MARERFAAPALPVLFAFWTLLAVQACLAASQELPATAPVPVGSPIAREDPTENPIAPNSPPLPQPRPDAGQAPEVAPQPIAKPKDTKPTDAETKPAKLIHAMTRFEKDDRIAGGETQADRDCRADLGKLDADFAVHPPLLDAVECIVVNPVTLKSLGKTIRLTPAAVMNCDMARATVRFMQDVAAPAAKARLGSDLAAVNHASAYVCRARNGNAKLSEHALGNAFDIASFVLGKRHAGRRQGRRGRKAGRSFSMRSARPRAGRSRPCSVRAAMPTTRCISTSTWPSGAAARHSASSGGPAGALFPTHA